MPRRVTTRIADSIAAPGGDDILSRVASSSPTSYSRTSLVAVTLYNGEERDMRREDDGMAMTLRDYFLTRCGNAMEAERNIEMLLAGMVEETRHGHLRDMLQQHHQAVQQEVTHLQKIANNKGSTRKRTTTEVREGEQLIIVGRGWIGSVGIEVVETHRNFIANTPEHLVDVNNALLDEEICHFNMGLYTGLIVVAKQLENTGAADLLQLNIDHENRQRMMLEESLWRIVRDRAEAPRKAA